MTRETDDSLWRDCPKTAGEFEARFASEEDCHAYWIEARWRYADVRALQLDAAVERARRLPVRVRGLQPPGKPDVGTLLEKTRKPLKTWFRAIFEISARRNGISAKDPQRITGFGSYKTAWAWVHKLRAATMRSDSEPLGPFVQMDEALVGGKGGPHKQLVLVAAEANGRVRLAHAGNNDAGTLEIFPTTEIAADAHVVTDGHAGYSATSLGTRPHERKVQTKAERREADALQGCHWTASLLKRWLLGTHAGAVKPKHLQAYLDSFAFRHNRPKTSGVTRIAARVIEQLVVRPSLTIRELIDDTRCYRKFASVQPATA